MRVDIPYQIKIAYARAREASNLAHAICMIAGKLNDATEWASVEEIAAKALEAVDDAENRLLEIMEDECAELAGMEVEAPLQ